MKKIKEIFTLLKIKIFDDQLEKQRKKAEKIYKEKQNTVICKYCKQLMNKKEAGSVYDFKTKELEFFHEDCFNENEHIGTLEDLMKNKR